VKIVFDASFYVFEAYRDKWHLRPSLSRRVALLSVSRAVLPPSYPVAFPQDMLSVFVALRCAPSYLLASSRFGAPSRCKLFSRPPCERREARFGFPCELLFAWPSLLWLCVVGDQRED